MQLRLANGRRLFYLEPGAAKRDILKPLKRRNGANWGWNIRSRPQLDVACVEVNSVAICGLS